MILFKENGSIDEADDAVISIMEISKHASGA